MSNVYERSQSLPANTKDHDVQFTGDDFDYVRQISNPPLESITFNRAPPPSRRRPSVVNRETKTMNEIPSLDLVSLQDSKEEAQRSSRAKYEMAYNDNPVRSPGHSNPSSNPSTPNEKRRELWADKRQADVVPLVSMSPEDLQKRIAALKKIIINFEMDFEDINGYKPRPSDKIPIQKHITELGRAKKQLKESLEPEEPTKEQTLQNLLKKLGDKRNTAGRPDELQEMTLNELKDEKLAVQKALLQYENLHERPVTKEDKILMRPLYDRYRKIKRRIAAGKNESPSKQSTVSSIYPDTTSSPLRINGAIDRREIEEIMDEQKRNKRNSRISNITTTSSSNNDTENENIEETLGDTFSVTRHYHGDTPEPFSPHEVSPRSIDEAVLHDATIAELLEQQRATKRVKKRLGKLLKEYEDEFYRTWNRKMQKDDRLPKEAEYREYKLVKAKLRLVEALIAKKSANNTV